MRGAQTACWAKARRESGSDGYSGVEAFRKRAQRCYLLARGAVFCSTAKQIMLASCKTLATTVSRFVLARASLGTCEEDLDLVDGWFDGSSKAQFPFRAAIFGCAAQLRRRLPARQRV